MAYGDIGGAVTELVITCMATTPVQRFDPVALVGNFEVGTSHGEVFGQALASADKSRIEEDGSVAVPVKVRGVAYFTVSNDLSKTSPGDWCGLYLNEGECRLYARGQTRVLSVDAENRRVGVLL